MPSGFTDQLVASGLDSPTSLAFLPDGRALVTEQTTGAIRLVVGSTVTSALVTVPSLNTSGSERGLLSIAVDPGWPARPYVYVHHTQTGSVMRVVRFTASGTLDSPTSTNLSLGSLYQVLTGLSDNAYNHNGGALRFGPDGMLYLSLGDDAVKCEAQDPTSLMGCVLRLDVSGLPGGAGGPPARTSIAPIDNPWAASPNIEQRLVFTYGLRNPFRIQIDPVSGEVFVADVGENLWEELSLLGAGDNGGWPFREGPAGFSPGTCSPPPGFVHRPPIDSYDHGDGVAIVAAGVYRRAFHSSLWPAAWDGDAFYADYFSGVMRRLRRTETGWERVSATGQVGADWATGLSSPVDFQWGPDGHLWWLSQWNGQLRKIVATGSVAVDGQAPARLALTCTPNPARGAVELSFDLPVAGIVRLAVFDPAGRRVALVTDGDRPAGSHRLRWGGSDERGQELPAGVYLARLDTPRGAITTRIAIVD